MLFPTGAVCKSLEYPSPLSSSTGLSTGILALALGMVGERLFRGPTEGIGGAVEGLRRVLLPKNRYFRKLEPYTFSYAVQMVQSGCGMRQFGHGSRK